MTRDSLFPEPKSDAEAPRPRLDRRRFLTATGTGGAALAAATAGAGALAAPRRAAAAAPGTPLMRRPGAPVPIAGGPPVPRAAIVALNRMAFGPRAGDLAAFDALGGNDVDRLTAYVDQQLDPGSIDNSALVARMNAAGYESIGLSDNPDTYLATLWAWYINDTAPPGNSTDTGWARDEMIRATFLRAAYSEAQLVEVLADFWHDHFNVHIEHSSFVRATFAHLDLVIRQNLLGNFRTMLEAVSRSTAMLYYLDNYTSSNAGPNENFCRELFELHTLGAENYLGVLQQQDVPTDGDGLPIGYVDADVFEAVRCFTGWSFSYGVDSDGDTGLFHYRPSWHDRFQKNVLGLFIPQDQPDLKDGRDVLDRLAAHPGTGRHIARRLCRRFIADDPPQSVVDAAAAVFTAQWQAPDQLSQVVRTILLSDEFRTTWAEKVKRPFEIAVSALRATGADFTPRMDDSDTNSFLWRFDDTGHEPFHWPAPNGFPDVRGAWTSMTPRVMGWRLVGWMIDFEDSQGDFYLPVVAATPAGVRTPNELADYWIDRILGRPMAPEARDEIVDFIGEGINPDFDLNLSDPDTADRLRAMVGLIMMSPDFLYR
ncbi:MAG: DUF1800 domain-containing protein [Acidobacteriota bacterium]